MNAIALLVKIIRVIFVILVPVPRR